MSSVDFSIIHAPRISPAGFRAILAAAGSPAASSAGACYAAFVAAGVDPAVALAVFRHESAFGRFGRAVSHHSWGNLRRSPDFPTVDGFAQYPTWAAGARDAARLLAIYGHNRIRVGVDTSTCRTFPFVWAPTADGNAPAAYGAALVASVDAWHRRYPVHPRPGPRPDPEDPRPPRRVHRVRPGESLWAIGAHFRVSWRRIYAANRRRIGPNPSLLHVGLLLVIPAS